MAFTDTLTDASTTNLSAHTPSGGGTWHYGAGNNALNNATGDASALQTGTGGLSTTNHGGSLTFYACDDQGVDGNGVQYLKFTIGLAASWSTNYITLFEDIVHSAYVAVYLTDSGGGNMVITVTPIPGSSGSYTAGAGTASGTTVCHVGDSVVCSLKQGTNQIPVVKINGVTDTAITTQITTGTPPTRQGLVSDVGAPAKTNIITYFEAGTGTGPSVGNVPASVRQHQSSAGQSF